MKYDINNNSRNNEESWKFYKIYSKGEKIYKGRVLKSSELSQFQYLGGVSCFIIDENGNVLIEKRGNTKDFRNKSTNNYNNKRKKTRRKRRS